MSWTLVLYVAVALISVDALAKIPRLYREERWWAFGFAASTVLLCATFFLRVNL